MGGGSWGGGPAWRQEAISIWLCSVGAASGTGRGILPLGPAGKDGWAAPGGTRLSAPQLGVQAVLLGRLLAVDLAAHRWGGTGEKLLPGQL